LLWKDLREFIAKLDELGELKTIRGAGWEEEIGGISELVMEQHGSALLFDDVPGYPSGYRIAVNLFGSSIRTAVALGLATEPTIEDLPQRWLEIVRKIKPIPPQEVKSGPILENVMQGDDVDLFKFPTPQWHENDGGRYIGTGVCVINQDPETGHVNSGSYRVSIQDQRTCGLFIERDKGADVIRRKYWARGEKCPVVISVGQDPILTALGGPAIYQTPANVSEFAVAGFLQGEPYPVIKAPITGIPMPAHAEIVIEGYIPSPAEAMMPEGPFGEWTGYYAHGRRPETIVEVAAIYHRNDPIIFGSPPVRPLGRSSLEMGGEDIGSHLKLDKADIAGVKRVYYMGKPNFRVVSIQQQYPGHVDDIVKVLVPEGQQYYGHQILLRPPDLGPGRRRRRRHEYQRGSMGYRQPLCA
jgi:UbiD family decarboxylase